MSILDVKGSVENYVVLIFFYCVCKMNQLTTQLGHLIEHAFSCNMSKEKFC